ncbi:MAG: hypothetical protein F6K14_21600 [Symploca sp. SIO2C1]|nr:hypothetical protein [Symploca sp. SIO2C1]
MKLILNKIFPRLAGTVALALTTVTLLGRGVSAIEVEIKPQVLNGLHYPTSSQQFFERGKRNFEQEIQLMLQRLQSSPETLLHITDELPAEIREEWLRQEELWLQENLQIEPQDSI